MIQKDHIILCHTPLGDKTLVQNLSSPTDAILVMGPRGTQLKLA